MLDELWPQLVEVELIKGAKLLFLDAGPDESKALSFPKESGE